MPSTNASLADTRVEPWLRELTSRWGAVEDVRALGPGGSCWRVVASRPLVVKRMPCDRPPALLEAIRDALGHEHVPALLDHVDRGEVWYGVFEHLPGAPPRDVPDAALALLARLHACPVRPAIDLVATWLERLSATRLHDAPAELLRSQLCASPAAQAHGLAHGDFAPQNLLVSADRIALVDWEQCGSAPAAFDAGWSMALARTRMLPEQDADALGHRLTSMGLEPEALRWFEALGVLRLLYRVRASSALTGSGRQAAVGRIRAAVLRLLD